MKKSYIIGGVVAVLALASLAIFWPKGSKSPASSEEHAGETHENPTVEGLASQTHELGLSADGKNPSAVSASDDPKMKKVESFLTHSRVLDEFKAMDDLLEAQLEQIQDAAQLSSADQEELDKLKKIVSSETLLANYKDLMYKEFDEKELDHLNEIYQNPLISKFKEAQVYNQSPEGQKELIDYWKGFKPESLPAERLAELKEYDKRTGGTENTLKMIKSVGEMTGNNSKDPKKKKENEEFDKSLRTAVEQANLISNSKTMANDSDDDIRSRNKIVSDPAFQKEGTIKQRVLNGSVEKMGHIMMEKGEKEKHAPAKGN